MIKLWLDLKSKIKTTQEKEGIEVGRTLLDKVAYLKNELIEKEMISPDKTEK